MTMKLTIKNDDATRTALVQARDASYESGQATGEFKNSDPARELAPGQSAEFYVHSTRDLVVSEKQG